MQLLFLLPPSFGLGGVICRHMAPFQSCLPCLTAFGSCTPAVVGASDVVLIRSHHMPPSRAATLTLLASDGGDDDSGSNSVASRLADDIKAKGLKGGRVRAPRRLRGAPPLREQGKDAKVRELQQLYITGGSCRGRRLRTPNIYLRPMMSRVREALFSMLYSTGVLRDSAKILDIFAGSGSIGLESLSRGMGSATFVDMSPVCAATIRENVEALGFSAQARVVEARADELLTMPARFGLDGTYDLVSMSPPYEEVEYSDLMQKLADSPLLDEDSLVVVEYPIELGVFPPTLADGKLVGLRNRRYGRTVLALYVCRPSGRIEYDARFEEFVEEYIKKGSKKRKKNVKQ